jgi:hypothetical protein
LTQGCQALAERAHVLLSAEIPAARHGQKTDASLVAVDKRHWGCQCYQDTTKDTKSTKGSENKTFDALFVLCHPEVDEVTVNVNGPHSQSRDMKAHRIPSSCSSCPSWLSFYSCFLQQGVTVKFICDVGSR